MKITITTKSRDEYFKKYLRSVGFDEAFIENYDTVSVEITDEELEADNSENKIANMILKTESLREADVSKENKK